METITVYRFTMPSIAVNEMMVSARWGTREGIGRRKATVVENTAAEVDANAIDPEGFTSAGFDPDGPRYRAAPGGRVPAQPEGWVVVRTSPDRAAPIKTCNTEAEAREYARQCNDAEGPWRVRG